MNRSILAYLIASMLAVIVRAGEQQTELRALWRSSLYSSKAVPTAWLPASVPPTERDKHAFQQSKQRFTTTTLIARFGLPDRYLVSQMPDKNDFLIYDLPSGVSVAVYVSEPPAQSISAIAVINAKGEMISLIK